MYFLHIFVGLLRTSEEMSAGDVDVTGPWSPYFLTNFTYSEQDFDRLMKLTQYNLLNHKDLIIKALHTAVERRKARNLQSGLRQTQTKQRHKPGPLEDHLQIKDNSRQKPSYS